MAKHTPPANAKQTAHSMLEFINQAWTPWHAVEDTSRRLLAAGFQHLAERDAWDLQPGGKYFFTRNQSTIVAFAVGKKYQPGNPFYMVGAHTDSPCLKLKPNSKTSSGSCLQCNVETYGGGLWATWFDRDLSVAGRVLVRDGEKLAHRLVKIDRPILRIPMLAIHLNRTINSDGFKPNTQKELMPILATSIKAQLNKADANKPADASDAAGSTGAAPPSSGNGTGSGGSNLPGDFADKHHTVLLELLAQQLGCKTGDIVDFELNVCDVQPGQLFGAFEEFVAGGRLDNLASCYVALQALVESCSGEGALDEETAVRSVAFFDHEEVGSDSAQGAGGPVMRDTIARVARHLSQGQEGAIERTLRSSFLISADMAHALHPNYTEKHDPGHAPAFHAGLVVKHNSNQRYATNAISAALFREVGRRVGVPCQEFCVRNDMPCGSTIGPILASSLGCRTVDVGMPQLAMHSIREMCGVDDVALAQQHFLAFFRDFSAIDATLDIDSLPPPDIRGTIRDPQCTHVH